ncbi:MAG: helix-turn-helix transcriptional regulator [Clostridia bacterium]|nr:helix-turn-helix transcriptional regulator [Clostridia bacterium]
MAEYKLSEEQVKMISILSRALPHLRKDLGVSQTQLAEKVGISRQMISLIERGLQPMTWTQFLAIVFFFKCNNDFDRGKKKIAQKYPNVVEQILLLEYQLNTGEETAHDR